MLFRTEEQKITGFSAIDQFFPTRPIAGNAKARVLPEKFADLDRFSYQFEGRSWIAKPHGSSANCRHFSYPGRQIVLSAMV